MDELQIIKSVLTYTKSEYTGKPVANGVPKETLDWLLDQAEQVTILKKENQELINRLDKCLTRKRKQIETKNAEIEELKGTN